MASQIAASNYQRVWSDYLSNRRDQAASQASACLSLLEKVDDKDKNVDDWINEADFRHILGAIRSDSQELRRAVRCYDEHLKLAANNANALRMKAETLLRLFEYEEAFQVMDQVVLCKLQEDVETVEVAPFRLRHDADLLDYLGIYPERAETFREVAQLMDKLEKEVKWDGPVSQELKRTTVGALPAWRQKLVGLNQTMAPPTFLRPPVFAHLDWGKIREDYLGGRLALVDDLFSPAALQELQRFSKESFAFRTMRAGFLGAFPGDGAQHPLILDLCRGLQENLPEIFGDHALGLYWFFKYTDMAPRGIGIHADPAAVNINIWLTPDDAILEGGGLEIFKYVPQGEGAIQEFNHEFRSPEEEQALHATLSKSGTTLVEYKCNRAAIFVSDQYHVSQPFKCKPGYENYRVNLTLLFGDRQIQEVKQDCWDLFD